MYRPGVLLLALSLTSTLYAQDFRSALYRYMPVMRFDSDESFFPVRAKSITNNPGNALQRADETICNGFGCITYSGEVLAQRNANGTGLNIGYLIGPAGALYPHLNKKDVRESDRINEQGKGFDNAKADARQFQTSDSYRDRIYGHVIPVSGGAWLQYWFFYYYNHFPFDDHEGDWETIQIFVNNDLQPQIAVYAQHNGGTYCPWAKVPNKLRGRPVVFVARGSHASYFKPGNHAFFYLDLANDYTDGQRTRPIKLIRLGNTRPRWINWPGSWGASKRVSGPKSHGQWDDPEKFYQDASLDGQCNQ